VTDLHHLAAAYALDALEPDERERFEAHLASCTDCAADVREFRATTDQLGAAAAVAPPAHLRGQILGRVAATPQLPAADDRSIARRRRVLPVAAAAVMIVVALAMGVVARGALTERDRAEELLAVLAAVDATVVQLEPAEVPGTVRVVWSSSQGAAVVVGADLPHPGDDQTYELWALAADGPRSAGLFIPDDGGRVERRVSLPADPEAGWGITIEPDGGSPQPTGAILYLG
jgi:anti-sigma-K factor RskA